MSYDLVNDTYKDGDTPLFKALWRKKSHDIAILLLDRGADIYATNSNKETPLHVAASMGINDIVSVIIKINKDHKQAGCHGIENVCDAKDKGGMTPIMEACRMGRTDTVKILL